ncbi:hypothetical protein J2Z21_002181 [Streptomyces griseochromogenes]|uniref:DUF397 domain-containing protein n=1 Tax=Streptomyces griseochromogenes TaxID=68214 RepID=A0A1B1ARM6_9ACTN|nr:DUF397 domain-containing protein [Streptomyces griseochromogenes]ANP49205.1 DUF397 domain-containing protein [Streptomyces griseochromogenes]MBP2049250.1 hypothetical protein [Streptomyces griseochromogenes]
MTEQHIIADASTLDGWRKSTYSGGNEGSCLEVLDNQPHAVPVRDSKAPHGPALVFGASAWSSFVSAVRERFS